MRAVVVGRFQPLHDGHASLLRLALAAEGPTGVVVAVGSSQSPRSLRNPFSFQERRAMMEAAFPGLPAVPVPDIHDDARWVAHLTAITGPVTRMYGNDERTLRLFTVARIPTVRPGLVERDRWQATTIRSLLAAGDPAWRTLVPAPVAALLDGWKAEARLRGLADAQGRRDGAAGKSG